MKAPKPAQAVGCESSPESPETRPAVELDLREYRTDELVGKLAGLLDLPASAAIWARTSLLFAIGGSIGVAAIGSWIGLSSWLWWLSLIYGAAASLLLGLFLGGVRMLIGGTAHLKEILQLTISVSGKVAADYRSYRDGGLKIPSGPLLVRAVNEQVMEPAIREVIRARLGRWGAPLAWGYQGIVGRAIRWLTTGVQTGQDAEQQVERAEPESAKPADRLSGENGFLNRASTRIDRYAARVVRIVAIALWILWGLAVAWGAAPLLVIWILGGPR